MVLLADKKTIQIYSLSVFQAQMQYYARYSMPPDKQRVQGCALYIVTLNLLPLRRVGVKAAYFTGPEPIS